MQFSQLRSTTTILSLMLLAACGGGGGGGGGSASVQEPASTQVIADSSTTQEDQSVQIDVLANDTDINPATLSVQQPANGTTTTVGSQVRYTPNLNFNGNDSFTYSVTSTTGSRLTGTVMISVTSVNDPPAAVDDSIDLIENTPTDLAVTLNDIDIDSALASVSIITSALHGSVQADGLVIRYLPDEDFTGTDSIIYQVVDSEGAMSNPATVDLNILPISVTSLNVTSLPIPTSNYNQLNNAELGASVLTSLNQTFELPPNTVSFTLSLQGNGVGQLEQNVFIAGLIRPDQRPVIPLVRDVTFCDRNFCSALIPRKPSQTTEAGRWQYSLGTLHNNLSDIDFSNMTLQLTTRVGPKPDLTGRFPATLHIKPYSTAVSATNNDILLVLAALEQFANLNGLALDIAPITNISDPQFQKVAGDFNNSRTASLVGMGEKDRINIFFLEGFAGADAGLLGVSGGLPGPLGIQSQFNGVLVSATATRGQSDDFYARTTAEIAFHEMGHLLGLYHTTEQSGDLFDVIDDTAECIDLDGDGTAEISECDDSDNIMFWNNVFTPAKQPLSAQQQQVIYLSPLATP